MKFYTAIYRQLNTKEKIKFYWIIFFVASLLILEFLSLGLLLPIIQIFFTAEKISILSEEFFFNNLKFEKQISFLLIFLIALYLIKNTVNSICIYLKKKFLADIQINFTSRVFSYYLNQPYAFFLRNNKPQIIRNIGILPQYIDVLENFINIFIEVFILILIMGIIYYNDINIGLFITFFSIFFVFVVLKFFKKRLTRYGEIINEYNAKVVNNYLDTLGSIKDIILQKKESFFVKNFTRNISTLANVNVKNGFLVELPRLIIEIILVIGISCLIFFLVHSNQDINNIPIILTFTVALILRAIPSITRIIYQSSGLYFKIDIVKRVHNLLETLSVVKNDYKINKIDFQKIRLKNINFSYTNNHENILFKNLSYEIKKNECVGVIGSSGSGKSTLLDILCCMLAVENGGVYLDEIKIEEKNAKSWHSQISYISQKNFLLNSTIAKNIAFAENDEEIDKEKLLEAIEFSQLNKLVGSKAEGINFNIGEDGKNISGGQRQRIILARAIYREADVILFDEATSALDTETEKEIFSTIKKNFYGKKTLLISSHKRETLYFCDKIIDINTFNK
ncbi:ABC transporter ATP-binding protein/permease [Candidatus Pelagibacter sp.]|nr:ABC transporter ATP-binding protein/permease [Candidatus Pelagibacter sp.]